MTEGHVTTPDGVRLFFQMRGTGPQIVLFPSGFHLADDFTYLAEGRTLIFYDVRNRGRSDAVADEARLARGVQHDVEDVEAVRRHFDVETVGLVGHSYIGLMVILYAIERPEHVTRVVQLSPMEPYPGKQYPAHLTHVDDVLRDALRSLEQLQAERQRLSTTDFCRKFWSVLRPIYVADPADAAKITWDRCDLPNEVNFMTHWMGRVLPSLGRLGLTPEQIARAAMPVLTVHGRKDRSAPYGGAREWGMLLPDARLLTVDRAAHAPWIEAPDEVRGPVDTFLSGTWPPAARRVSSLDSEDRAVSGAVFPAATA
jgi:pimeloyl-ACP methyl ester carboxylesterase